MVSERTARKTLSNLSSTQLKKLVREFGIYVLGNSKHQLIDSLLLKQIGGADNYLDKTENLPDPALAKVIENLSYPTIVKLRKAYPNLDDRLNEPLFAKIVERQLAKLTSDDAIDSLYWDVREHLFELGNDYGVQEDPDNIGTGFVGPGFVDGSFPHVKSEIPLMVYRSYMRNKETYVTDCKFDATEKRLLSRIFGNDVPNSMFDLYDLFQDFENDINFPIIITNIFHTIRGEPCAYGWNEYFNTDVRNYFLSIFPQ